MITSVISDLFHPHDVFPPYTQNEVHLANTLQPKHINRRANQIQRISAASHLLWSATSDGRNPACVT